MEIKGEMQKMQTDFEVIVFRVHREADGLFTATSPQLDGVFVSHRNLVRIIEDLPNITKLWFKRHKNAAVEILTGTRISQDDDTASVLVGIVPAEIAARALAH
jgi:hypothetical protein